jgi:hypothetical protein
MQRLPPQRLGRHLDALVDREALKGGEEGDEGLVGRGEQLAVGAAGASEAVELLVAVLTRRDGMVWGLGDVDLLMADKVVNAPASCKLLPLSPARQSHAPQYRQRLLRQRHLVEHHD